VRRWQKITHKAWNLLCVILSRDAWTYCMAVILIPISMPQQTDAHCAAMPQHQETEYDPHLLSRCGYEVRPGSSLGQVSSGPVIPVSVRAGSRSGSGSGSGPLTTLITHSHLRFAILTVILLLGPPGQCTKWANTDTGLGSTHFPSSERPCSGTAATAWLTLVAVVVTEVEELIKVSPRLQRPVHPVVLQVWTNHSGK
jgi:hypothetical protein